MSIVIIVKEMKNEWKCDEMYILCGEIKIQHFAQCIYIFDLSIQIVAKPTNQV